MINDTVPCRLTGLLYVQFPVLTTLLYIVSGLLKNEAQILFLLEVYQLESYGVSYYAATLNGADVRLAIGARHIRILDSRRRCIKK